MSYFRYSGLMALVLLVTSIAVHGAEETVTFNTPEQATLYHSLLREYRCLKCQNQNLADSHASLASDLRREIRDQILAGKAQADIDEYLVSRYGEFVLYRPRFSGKTAVLWLGPFVLLLAGLAGVFVMIRRRGAVREAQLAAMQSASASGVEQADRLARARQLLDD